MSLTHNLRLITSKDTDILMKKRMNIDFMLRNGIILVEIIIRCMRCSHNKDDNKQNNMNIGVVEGYNKCIHILTPIGVVAPVKVCTLGEYIFKVGDNI